RDFLKATAAAISVMMAQGVPVGTAQAAGMRQRVQELLAGLDAIDDEEGLKNSALYREIVDLANNRKTLAMIQRVLVKYSKDKTRSLKARKWSVRLLGAIGDQ